MIYLPLYSAVMASGYLDPYDQLNKSLVVHLLVARIPHYLVYAMVCQFVDEDSQWEMQSFVNKYLKLQLLSNDIFTNKGDRHILGEQVYRIQK